MRIRDSIAVATAALCAASMQSGLAQSEDDAPEDTFVFVANSAAVTAFGGAVDVIRGEGSVFGEVVIGKPYSAESITESIQMLADGNRITSTHRARFYRDSLGRTRREQTLDGIGVWQTGSEPTRIVTINDPVENVSYLVDEAAQTVRKLRPYRLEAGRLEAPQLGAALVRVPEPGEAADDTVQGSAAHAPSFDVRVVGPGEPPPVAPRAGRLIAGHSGAFSLPVNMTATWAGGPLPAEVEDLGEQVLQGVLARGVRQTQTIPAGEIGNELRIDIATEQWYSDELEAVVSRTSRDPRFGETTYRLINVDRSEPPPELFAVPQGYRVEESTGPAGVRTFLAAPGIPGQRTLMRHEDAAADEAR